MEHPLKPIENAYPILEEEYKRLELLNEGFGIDDKEYKDAIRLKWLPVTDYFITFTANNSYYDEIRSATA